MTIGSMKIASSVYSAFKGEVVRVRVKTPRRPSYAMVYFRGNDGRIVGGYERMRSMKSECK